MGKGLQDPVELQRIMVEDLRGHKMDFQSPGGGGAQSSKNRKRRMPGAIEGSILGKA
jgi:hypothetical protein